MDNRRAASAAAAALVLSAALALAATSGRLAVDRAWAYTQASDGGFAAFVGRGRVAIESRWLGPAFVVIGGRSPLVGLPGPVPLAQPGGGRSLFGPSAAISGGGKLMVAEVRSAAEWWRVWVWSLAGGQRRVPIAMAGKPVAPLMHALAFSPEGRLVSFFGTAPGDTHLGVILCRTTNGGFQQALKFPEGVPVPSASAVVMITFASAHRVDCVTSRNGRIRVFGWRLPSGRPSPMMPLVKASGVWCGADDRRAHELLLSGVAARGKMPNLLIVSSRGGSVISRDTLGGIGGGNLGAAFTGSMAASGIAVSPDGNYAVVVGFGRLAKRRHGSRVGGWLRVVDLRAGSVVYGTDDLPANVPWHVAVSPGGRRLVVASNTKFYIFRAPFKL